MRCSLVLMAVRAAASRLAANTRSGCPQRALVSCAHPVSSFQMARRVTPHVCRSTGDSLLFLAGRVGVEKVSADSGGFPTPLPTATLIPLPTLMPTPTATLIPLPTQASSAQKSLADSALVESETAAQSADAEQEQLSRREARQEARSSSSGMSTFSRFFVGFLIGLAILGLVWLIYRMLVSTGVIH